MNFRQKAVNSIIVMLFELEQKGYGIHYVYDLKYFSYEIFKNGSVVLADKIESRSSIFEVDLQINNINEIH